MLANINKNVLVEHCNNIAESVVKDGYLLTSGYYTFDAPTIEMVFEKLGFIKIKNTIQDEWNCHLFQKMQ
jgi:ribosomal protein L11 methyltransferase